MGMDLKPIRPTKDAPRDQRGCVIYGRYNWSGWNWLASHLQEWGVDTSSFKGCNDGDVIPAAKCREIADAIEAHLGELDDTHREWLEPHVIRWRTCGGYEQW